MGSGYRLYAASAALVTTQLLTAAQPLLAAGTRSALSSWQRQLDSVHMSASTPVGPAHARLHNPCWRVVSLQSAKLKQAQEQANNLTKEKESLMQVIQELKARIKQGMLLTSTVVRAAASAHAEQVLAPCCASLPPC